VVLERFGFSRKRNVICVPSRVKGSEVQFSEDQYLSVNPDVRQAVQDGKTTATKHWETIGIHEDRWLANDPRIFSQLRQKKFEFLRANLMSELIVEWCDTYVDCLPQQLRDEAAVHGDGPISSHEYGVEVTDLINGYSRGWILDCGAGFRPTYYSNVINLEIAPYITTDVVGIAESLPFKDNSFDAAVSIAVLEHVRDPFLAAKEIMRVVKPGGTVLVAVPFLQPRHGYPNHYYNMTEQGLENLFQSGLSEYQCTIPDSGLPHAVLTWVLRGLHNGLPESEREEFLSMTIREIVHNGDDHLLPLMQQLRRHAKKDFASFNMLKGTVR